MSLNVNEMDSAIEESDAEFNKMIILAAKSSHFVLERAVIMDNMVINGTKLENLLQVSCATTSNFDKSGNTSKENIFHDEQFSTDLIPVDENGCAANILHKHITELFNEEQWNPRKFHMNAKLFFHILKEVKVSRAFRRKLIQQVFQNQASEKFIEVAKHQSSHHHPGILCRHAQVEVELESFENTSLDRAWNYRVSHLVADRVELENVMAWLSTLGGAYSALGDEFLYCAEVAGKISIRQLQLALRLGDPFTVARCKVYFALSLLQRGFLKKTAELVREQYKCAMSYTENARDQRLINMCKGIWAKLKYTQQKHKNLRIISHSS